MVQNYAIVSGLDSLHEPGALHISPWRLSKALGVNLTSLAALAGVHRDALLNPSSEQLQSRMREMVTVISAAIELAGDVKQAIFWYRNEPIVDYSHRTAAELVASGQAETALTYIRDLENGARG